MADDSADGAEVLRRISLWVVERWAQDSCWEGDVIDNRIVESVYRLRGAEPLITVSWLANLVQLKVMCPGIAVAQVLNQIRALGGEFQPGVITPGIGNRSWP